MTPFIDQNSDKIRDNVGSVFYFYFACQNINWCSSLIKYAFATPAVFTCVPRASTVCFLDVSLHQV